MIWPTARCILLVSDDVRCLNLVATELRAAGCRVLCARDMEQAAGLVRAKLTTQFVLVFLGDNLVVPADLRAAMAAHLPGWVVRCDQARDEPDHYGAAENGLVN